MNQSKPMEGVDPLISLGMNHAGGDQLFQLLRQGLSEMTHYPEPFHPSLGSAVAEEPSNETDRPFPDEVVEHYRDQAEVLDEWFEPAFGRENLFLDGMERIGPMDRYLVELANSGDPVHFFFKRALGRLDYLRGLFPSARCLLIIRNPFAIWTKWYDDPVEPYDVETLPEESGLDGVVRALRLRLPDGSREYWGIDDLHRNRPLDTFLGLWGFQYYLALQQISDYPRFHALRYEDLVHEYDRSLNLIEEDLEVSLGRDNLSAPGDSSIDGWRDQFTDEQIHKTIDRLPDDSPIHSLLSQFEYA